MAPLESATQIPPEGLLGPSLRRKEPHIYSDEELVALLHAAMALSPLEGLRRHTYATLFGLLASTGLRISEALHLTHPEVDLTKGILLVSKGKFRQERLVPLHITTTQAMREYAQHRDHYHRNPASLTFFLSERGTPVKYITACSTFAKLRRRLGWRSGPSGRPPRIHDLRHTFAVRRLLQWYQEGADVDCNIAALSTYLGHVKVSSTYWYLTAVPELLAVAAARFEHFARDEQGGIR
jgi:integrase